MSQETFSGAPQETLNHVMKIQDEPTRDRILFSGLKSWLTRQPPAAEQWIQDHALPEDLLKQVRAPDSDESSSDGP